ncbi:MAG TPA: hypothetical protein VLV16_15715, partial [Gemmatimonadales bacterium]|nr:hypothetical protein [Gemmatimonadales bacterium]
PPMSPRVAAEMAATREKIRANRQKVVASSMDLTAAENEKFWPLYREYRDSMGVLGDRWVKMVSDYAQVYSKLTDQQAIRFLTEYTKYDSDRIVLRTTYIRKFGAILPPRKVMRYFQIENKLDAIINYDLAGEIPLAK